MRFKVNQMDVRKSLDPMNKLRALCNILVDDAIVIHEVKLLEVAGVLKIGMPNRQVTKSCQQCNRRSPVVSNYCSHCGFLLPVVDISGTRIYNDIIHPVNQEIRLEMEKIVIAHYKLEMERLATTSDSR